MTERQIKRARLDTVLHARGLDELVLRDPANLAWYLGGARMHVVPGDPIAEVTVGAFGEELRTTVIEAPRLRCARCAGGSRSTRAPRPPLGAAATAREAARWTSAPT
jgi:hypothetical protein